jgi:hypothetical protein
VFNLADSAIVVAGVFMVVLSARGVDALTDDERAGTEDEPPRTMPPGA